MRPIRFSSPFLLLGALAAGCAGGDAAGSPAVSPAAERPSSPATITIVTPTAGETVGGPNVRVEVSLDGAVIVPETTTDLQPDTGHLHLYVDNGLVTMNYGLEQDIPITNGTHVIKAEFVAADHAPFNPRIWTDDIIFTVR
jgi:hypothetical protein